MLRFVERSGAGRRFGLTAKTLVIACLVVGLALAATVRTRDAFRRIDGLLDRLSSSGMDQVMTSVRLVQQADSLAILGMMLSQAEDHNERRRTLVDLRDRLGWINKLSARLSVAEGDQAQLERMRVVLKMLERNLEELNLRVMDRIDGDSSNSLRREIRQLADRDKELCEELSVVLGYFSEITRSQVQEQSADLAEQVKDHQRQLLVLTLLLLLSVVGAIWFFERRVVRRIVHLQRAIGRPEVRPEDLNVGGVDEITQMAETMGDYVRRIQAQETSMRRTHDELAFLAEHDPLTQLSNRRHFDVVAHRMLQQSRLSLCVAIGDIDHFKRVNDEYGHAVGDRALIQIARQVQSGLRESDLLARFGGEEFTAVMAVRNIDEAFEALDRIRAAIAGQPLHLDGGHTVSLTMSFGVALIDGLPLSAAQVLDHGQRLLNQALRAADDALYEAKRTGRDRVCLAPEPVYLESQNAVPSLPA